MRLSIVLLLTSGLLGCLPPRATKVPLDTLAYDAPAEKGQTLLVLLPGRGSSASDFEDHGFIDAVRAAHAGVDVVAADAHLGYYTGRSLPQRVWEDVIEPRQDIGYEQVWLAGTSMGGFGAVVCAREYGDAVTGILLLSPYLGPEGLLRSIEQAGGAAAWVAPDNAGDMEEIWSWLQGYTTGEPRPRILLGFGESDRLNRGHELLSALLPDYRVIRVDGGHGWRVWDSLWPEVLEAWCCEIDSCN